MAATTMPSSTAPQAATGAPERVPLLRRQVTGPAVAAALAVVAVAVDQRVYDEITLGTLVGLALAPVWLPALRRYHGLRTLVVLGVGAIGLGLLLTELAGLDHGTSLRNAANQSIVVLNLVLGVSLVAWARTQLSDPVVATVFGVGMVLGIRPSGRFAENPWRFGFSLPLVVLLLGLAWLAGRAWLQVVVALGLALVSAANGGRSTSAMLVLAAVVTMWQAGQAARSARPASRMRSIAVIAALLGSFYYLGQAAILDGFLGEAAQSRTQEQIALSGSLIQGARPEMGATGALIGHRPWGFGSGTLANTRDVMVAKSGMSSLGYDPDNGYVERYMLGSGIELHSTGADLWVAFGVLGVALAAWILWTVLRGYTTHFAAHTAAALLTYLAIRNLWDLLFSPLGSSITLLTLGVGLLALRRPEPRPPTEPFAAPVSG